MTFQKATKKKAKLRLALGGVAGSGKTYSALEIAKHLGGKVAVIDTEHGSASKYADRFSFDVMEPEDFSPETYIKGIHAAAEAGYDVLILDSLSHEWVGKGGALELVDRFAVGGNKFTDGWGKVTPMHTRLVDAVLGFPGHVIATMRAKTKYEVEKNERGKSVPKKVGLELVQREGMDYEYDVLLMLDTDGNVRVDKSRCPGLSTTSGAVKWADIPKIAATLQAWLSDGVDAPPAPVPTPLPTPAAPPKPPLSHFLDRYLAALDDSEREAALEGLTPAEKARVVGAASKKRGAA